MGDKEKWMQLSRTEGAFAVSLLALALVGCQSDRFGSLPTRSPQPLQPAPAGNVMQSQLPPPSQPTGVNDFPVAPGQENGPQMAAIDPQAAATSAPEVSKNGLLGSWNVASGGTNCQMFLTLTEYGDSSRGGTRGCSNELANMRAWDVSGNRVLIFDDGGNVIAQLYSSGNERLDGQTTGGASVTLSR